MAGQGRLIGIIMILAGLAVGGALIAWGLGGMAEGQLRGTGFALLAALVLMVIVVPLVGGGLFMMTHGKAEEVEIAEIRKQQRLIGMIETQGTLSIGQAAVELNVSRDVLREYVYDLVGKGLFTGYIDWQGGRLVAQDAVQIQSASANGQCPNCGGQVELAGKGLVRCPYCGAEIFLKPSAVAGGR